MKAKYKIDGGVLIVTATLPSGKEKSEYFILQNLLAKCVSILDLEFMFRDDDNKEYYYSLSSEISNGQPSAQAKVCDHDWRMGMERGHLICMKCNESNY